MRIFAHFRSKCLFVVFIFLFNGCAMFENLYDDNEGASDYQNKIIVKKEREPSKRQYIREPSEYGATDRAIMRGDIFLGMKEHDVKKAWGEPSSIEVAGEGSRSRYNTNARWLYNGAFGDGSKVVYFEKGKVAGWEIF